MGISGLLPLLKDIQTPKHVADYRGQTIGIDAYVWLHRGAYGCAREILLNQPTDRYIAYAVGRIRLLQHHGITPYIVFDGDRLPAKQCTEDDREQKRADYLERARALERAGDVNEARELYAKCVDITPAMAYQLIKLLRRERIPYVVAPFEADAQLAFLERQGLIDGIITEDSDLLVFGCEKVLFKLDQGGHCIEILRSRFALTRQVILSGWTPVEFRQMAILSGCDYLPSIVGMGLKNAHRLLRRYKTVEKVLQAVRLEGKMRVPPAYAREFRKAELTFVHQRVWDPTQGRMTTLTPLPDGTSDDMVPFIGAPIDDELARQIAVGDVDPVTRLAMVDLLPTPPPRPSAASGLRSNSWTGSSSGSTRSSAFTRSTTSTTIAVAAGGSGNSGNGGAPSLSPFYRPSVGLAKKPVSTEAGLQTIKNFFGAKPAASPKPKPGDAPAAIAAAAGPSRIPLPLSTRDTNATRRAPSPPSSSPSAVVVDKGKRKAVQVFEDDVENAPLELVGATPKPVKSKFFKRTTEGSLEAAAKSVANDIISLDVATAAEAAAVMSTSTYLELDGRTPRRATIRFSQTTPSKIWEGCEDMDEFMKSSPSQHLAAASAGPSRQSNNRLQRLLQDQQALLPSSSPFATPRDDPETLETLESLDLRRSSDVDGASVVAQATPRKRKRPKSGDNSYGRNGDAAEDSDHSSGFISSPASSVRPQRHRRMSSDAFGDLIEGDEGDDDTMPSSPISPFKARKNHQPAVTAAAAAAAAAATRWSEGDDQIADPMEIQPSSDSIEADDDAHCLRPQPGGRQEEAAASAVGRSLMAQFGWQGGHGTSPPSLGCGPTAAAATRTKISPPPPPPASRPARRSPSDQTPRRPTTAARPLLPISNRTPTATAPSPAPATLGKLDAFRFGGAETSTPIGKGKLFRTVSDNTESGRQGQGQGETKRAVRPTPSRSATSCSTKARLTFVGDDVENDTAAVALGSGIKTNRLERFRFSGGMGASGCEQRADLRGGTRG